MEDFEIIDRWREAPLSALPGISPSWGEIGSFAAAPTFATLAIGESRRDIRSSPLRGRCPAGQRGGRRNSTFKAYGTQMRAMRGAA